ncbi:MAG: hypothetical protein II742_00175, partial [Clostridia bacterium]|nr:hypothetical protein [Clostridia bacterium]
FSNMLELLFPEDTNIRAKETYVNTILSENKVTEILTKFFEEKMDYLIFRFEEKDLNKMNHLCYLVFCSQ